MPETVRAVVVDPSSPQGLGLKRGRAGSRRSRRGDRSGHGDLVEPRRGQTRHITRTARRSPGLGLRRDRRGARCQRQRSGGRKPCRRHAPVGRLGGACARAKSCRGPLAGGGHRCPGRDATGRRADRIARAAPGRALARPQGAGRRRLGRGRAPRRAARHRLGRARLGPDPPAAVPRHSRRSVRRAHRARRRSHGRGTPRALPSDSRLGWRRGPGSGIDDAGPRRDLRHFRCLRIADQHDRERRVFQGPAVSSSTA